MISRKMWLAAVLNWRSATAFSEFLLNDHLAITPQFLWFFEALPCTGLCGSDCLGTPNQRIKLLKYLGSDRSAAADEGTPRLSSRHTINFDTRLLSFSQLVSELWERAVLAALRRRKGGTPRPAERLDALHGGDGELAARVADRGGAGHLGGNQR